MDPVRITLLYTEADQNIRDILEAKMQRYVKQVTNLVASSRRGSSE